MLNRILRDAKLFDAKLGQINGAGNTGAYLIQLVEGKVVARSDPEAKKAEETRKEEVTEAVPAKTSEPTK